MKFPTYIAILVILGAVSIGNVMAITYTTENVVVQRTGATPAAIEVRSSGASSAFKLQDIDNPQIYQFRLVGDGSRFDITDITHNRVNMAVLSSNGNVGIGTAAPVQKLDVAGNIRLTGNIVSPNDICIGTCP